MDSILRPLKFTRTLITTDVVFGTDAKVKSVLLFLFCCILLQTKKCAIFLQNLPLRFARMCTVSKSSHFCYSSDWAHTEPVVKANSTASRIAEMIWNSPKSSGHQSKVFHASSEKIYEISQKMILWTSDDFWTTGSFCNYFWQYLFRKKCKKRPRDLNLSFFLEIHK